MAYQPWVKVSGVWQKMTINWAEVAGGPTHLSDFSEDSTSRHVTDAEKAIWNAVGGDGGGLSVIWAEENAAFSTSTNGGFQFSFGNGATSTYGVTIPYTCNVIALGLSSNPAATATVELYVNGVATGKTVSLTAQSQNYVDITAETITAGDRITFKTIIGSGGGQVIVSAVLATEGVQGADGADSTVPGPPGVNWKGSWVTSTPYVEDDVVELAGSTYICTNDVTGSTTPDNDSSNWDLFTAKGTAATGAFTKADIEAVFTGEISTHSHAGASGSGEKASFYLGASGAITGIAGTEVTLAINETSVNSDTGVFELASNQVTIDKTGSFLMSFEASLESGGTARTTYDVWLEKNGVEVPGTRAASYQRGYNDGDTVSVSLIIPVTTGDVFQLRIVRVNGSGTTGLQNPNGTRLTFLEV